MYSVEWNISYQYYVIQLSYPSFRKSNIYIYIEVFALLVADTLNFYAAEYYVAS
jgi:hypothetical protein